MDEPDEQDLQVFHNDFQNLVKGYNESSNNFVNAAKEQDIQLFKVSENELVLLIREYNDMHDRLEKLKEKYY
ncbi:hypothetical protein [Sporosarcina ureae]|uniref:hypothetical protein n=1 Tax=Sporosarcina ureae TaxID=1571 RepID=UPI000A17987F|nr:hypothetical protein [Sporosarcina ureae]ARK21876.1 hypothetical protein SporoP32a_10275 [Sporosarcina ureae]